ncbi:MAG TPA: OmpA family protein [Denitromonas sp.]|nr:OmpA family protein [Denitromonas sp.]
MKPRFPRPILWISLACMSTGLAACLSPFATRPTNPLPIAEPSQISQVGFGTDANYVRCIPPVCPTRTPKTLDIQEAPVVPDLPARATTTPDAEIKPAVAEPAPPQSWSVPFAFGRAQIGPIGQGVLRQVIEALPQAGRIRIAGRTDSSGPTLANDTLAAARAGAVRDYLVKARPDLAEAMDIDAQGDCCFIAPNDTPASRARNRRVEITVASPAPPP